MKPKLYLLCDSVDNTGHGSIYSGRIVKEDGSEVGRHTSSSLDFLRMDLKNKIYMKEKYEIIDLINEEEFKIKEEKNIQQKIKQEVHNFKISNCGNDPNVLIVSVDIYKEMVREIECSTQSTLSMIDGYFRTYMGMDISILADHYRRNIIKVTKIL